MVLVQVVHMDIINMVMVAINVYSVGIMVIMEAVHIAQMENIIYKIIFKLNYINNKVLRLTKEISQRPAFSSFSLALLVKNSRRPANAGALRAALIFFRRFGFGELRRRLRGNFPLRRTRKIVVPIFFH